MYGAKDAVAQLAGTLPQRAVVPCFVRGARLRGCLGREIKPHSVLRPLRTPGRPRAGAVARVPFGRCHIHALRATWTSASRFGSVRGERQARVPPALLRVCACVRVCGLMLSSVFLQSFYYIYYLQKWGLHNRSQIPSDSENRRQIGGYIIAPNPI